MATNYEKPSASADLTEIEHVTTLDVDTKRATDAEHQMTLMQGFRRYPTATFWAIAMSFTIVMEGYDVSLLLNFFAYPQFNRKYGTYYPELDQYIIPSRWQAALGVAGQVGAILGLLINGYVTEKIGHRKVIMVNLVLLTAFIFLPFFANSIEVVLAGQFLAGIPWGVFSVQGPTYASEVCPLALRGFLTSFTNLCWAIGILIGAGVLQGMVANPTEWSYRLPFALQWIWPLPLFLVAWFAPDSPWWLVRKNRMEDAEKALTKLGPGLSLEEVKLRLAMMVHTNKLEKAMKTETSMFDCFRGSNWHRTEAACMVLAAQSLCGQTFAYVSTYFFIQAGLSPSDAFKINLGGIGVTFVGTCLS